MLPFYEEHDLPVLRILTDRGTEFCGRPDKHDYQLFLAINDIDHTKTKVKSPQTNGICERFHKTILQEFYQVAFRKNLYETVEQLQADLDQWLASLQHRAHPSGKNVLRKNPVRDHDRGQTDLEGEVHRTKLT